MRKPNSKSPKKAPEKKSFLDRFVIRLEKIKLKGDANKLKSLEDDINPEEFIYQEFLKNKSESDIREDVENFLYRRGDNITRIKDGIHYLMEDLMRGMAENY